MTSKSVRLLALLVIYVTVVYILPTPDGVDAQGWRVTGIFFATIAGLMLQPLPGSQVVIIGITMLVLVGGIPMPRALSGYSAASVWMVLAGLRSCPSYCALVYPRYREDFIGLGICPSFDRCDVSHRRTINYGAVRKHCVSNCQKYQQSVRL